MRKGVNAALKTKYESKEWKKWFVETAKRLMEKLDAESMDDNVSECSHHWMGVGNGSVHKIVFVSAELR